MSPLIIIFLITHLMKLVLANGAQCHDVRFSAIHVSFAALKTCLAWRSVQACKKGVGKIKHRKESLTRTKNCRNLSSYLQHPTRSLLPIPYTGEFFEPPLEGQYITWNLKSFPSQLLKDLSKYWVVVQYHKGKCLSAGVVVIENGDPKYRCEDIPSGGAKRDKNKNYFQAQNDLDHTFSSSSYDRPPTPYHPKSSIPIYNQDYNQDYRNYDETTNRPASPINGPSLRLSQKGSRHYDESYFKLDDIKNLEINSPARHETDIYKLGALFPIAEEEETRDEIPEYTRRVRKIPNKVNLSIDRSIK